jgi:hypothetical protein
MRTRNLLAVALLAGAIAARAVVAQEPDPGPVPANAFITYGGLDWAWASPCDGGCSPPVVFQDGFRYATPSEWAGRPNASAFLDPFGNSNAEQDGSGPRMRCASPWFDLVWDHCDYNDGSAGYVTSGPLNGMSNDNQETWLVRGGVVGPVVPEPGSMVLVATGLVGVFGTFRRRRFV